jgi:chromate transporter
VVLLLPRDAFLASGWVSDNTFLEGYGARARCSWPATRYPLLTFAVYLGAVVQPSRHGVLGAAMELVGIFLPGMLILIGGLPLLGPSLSPG